MGSLATLTYTIKQRLFFAGMLPVKLFISVLKQCNKISGLRKDQNETINLAICKTEYRENILFENNVFDGRLLEYGE